MSLAQRRRAVVEAEARAQACIERARGRIAARRDDRESALYPLAVGAGGVLAGALLEQVVMPAGRGPRPAEQAQTAATPGWLSLANTGLALRLWQQARPIIDALSRGPQSGDAAATAVPSDAPSGEAAHG